MLCDWVNEKAECIRAWIVILFFYNKCVAISVTKKLRNFMAVVEVERDMMQIEEFMTALFSNDFGQYY